MPRCGSDADEKGAYCPSGERLQVGVKPSFSQRGRSRGAASGGRRSVRGDFRHR